jgi:uncharacterized membrane protein YhhN
VTGPSALAAICMVSGIGAGLAARRIAEASAALKMLAASAYLAFAWQLGALDSTYGRWILAGLAASWLGDLLLISEQSPRLFAAGLFAFLAAHVLYAIAFLGREPSALFGAPVAVVMLVFSTAVLRWLTEAGLDGGMRDAVIVYLAAISAMVALAVATRSPAAAIGAFAFAASDLFVARNRFVVRSEWNRRLGLPLYFGAQLLIAWSIASSVLS